MLGFRKELYIGEVEIAKINNVMNKLYTTKVKSWAQSIIIDGPENLMAKSFVKAHS